MIEAEAPSVHVVTFGCRLNIVESEAIRAAAVAAGRSDLIVVNSCAVTGEAVRQARQTIRRLRRERPGAEIVVTGCAAQTEAGTFAAMPEVSRILGNEFKTSPTAWGAETASPPGGDIRIDMSDIMRAGRPPGLAPAGFSDHTRGFVQVQTGCDHRCTFCIIPFGRGNSRSVPVGEVVSSVRALVENGVGEIVLTGVDLTSWGADLGEDLRLGTLVRAVLRAVPELGRLRLSSIDSIEADAELLAALAEEERLMPHLHLSLQAGDDLILKRMKRRHTRRDAVRFCEDVRRLRPDIAFGADLIAGFPTETEEMFARSLDLTHECGLSFLHVFPFSARPGTPAARMPQTRGEVIRDRAARLREAGAAALGRHLDRQVGKRLSVLAEQGGRGHAEDFTSVALPANTPRGALVKGVASGHDGRRLTLATAAAVIPLGAGAGAGYPARP